MSTKLLRMDFRATDRESNLSISAWEYEAPTTMFGSEPLEEPFLVADGLLRQKGEVDLLEDV